MANPKIPRGAEFDKRWAKLDREEQRKLMLIARRGDTSDDPHEAALIGGFAAMQVERLGHWWMWLIGPVLAGVAVWADQLLALTDSSSYGIAVFVWALAWGILVLQRRWFGQALEKSEELIATSVT